MDNATIAVRITSKGLKHPETGAQLRPQYPAFSVQVAPVATLDTAAPLGQVLSQLLADKVKELAQLRERAEWIAGRKPFDPAQPEQVQAWWQSALGAVTLDAIHSSLFAPTTRTTSFGATRWKTWLKGQFLPALDAYYIAEGKGAMSAAKLSATLAIMGAGRDMASHNKDAFASRFLAMLDCPHEKVLEVVASDESQEAFAWVTANKPEASTEELEL